MLIAGESPKALAYCISLERRPDRWNAFLAQKGVLEFPVVLRVPAVDGGTVDIWSDDRVSLLARRNIATGERRDHSELNTRGAIGCYLSHLEIWKRVLGEGRSYAIVFEDDAQVPIGTFAAIQRLLDEEHDGAPWDVRLLGALSLTLASERGRASRDGWRRCVGFMGTHAYAITPAGAAKLLRRSLPIMLHVDGYMSICARFGDLRVECHERLKLLQRPSSSDIQELPCPICHIPSNRSLTRALRSVVVLLAALAALAGLAALAVVWRLRR